MLIDETTEVETTETETEETETEETTEETEVEAKPEKVEKTPETLEQREARLARQLEQTRKKLGKEGEPVVEKKSGGLDYGQKAYLLNKGVSDKKDIAFVQKEMKESGLELDELLENGYFKEKFSQFQALNKTADATPKGKRGGGAPTDSVEYWASKPIAEVPQDMRIQVVNYKLKKEQTTGGFYNS